MDLDGVFERAERGDGAVAAGEGEEGNVVGVGETDLWMLVPVMAAKLLKMVIVVVGIRR